MLEHFFKDTDQGRSADVFVKFNERERKARRWRWVKTSWNHQIGGVSTIAWILLSAAISLAVVHFFTF